MTILNRLSKSIVLYFFAFLLFNTLIFAQDNKSNDFKKTASKVVESTRAVVLDEYEKVEVNSGSSKNSIYNVFKTTSAYKKKDKKYSPQLNAKQLVILEEIHDHFINAMASYYSGDVNQTNAQLNACVKQAESLMVKDVSLYITFVYARDNYRESRVLDLPTIKRLLDIINKYRK